MPTKHYISLVVRLFFLSGGLAAQSVDSLVVSPAEDSLRVLGNDSLADSLKPEKESKSFLEEPVVYNGTDSIVVDLKKDLMHIHGEADLTYGSTNLKADYIRINMSNSVLFAKGRTQDSTGKYIDRPIFEDASQSFTSDSMSYSFETEKGKIFRAKTTEGDGYIHGDQIKLMDKTTMFIKNGKYTTCQLDTPHFYIHASKLKLIKDDKIITGAANLKVDDAPTPLVVPFGFFPAKREKNSGIVMPATYGFSPEQGAFITKAGYYFALSDYYDLETTFDVYSLGSWAAYGYSNYKKRYKYNGSLGVDYSVFKTGFRALKTDTASNYPFFSKVRNVLINWNHTQDPKANPKYRFSAQVKAGSVGAYRNNINTTTQNYVSTSFNSRVNLSRILNFKRLNTSGNLSFNASHNQNIVDSSITITLPDVDFNIASFYPFKTSKNVGDKWFERLRLNYSSKYKAEVQDKLDSNFLSTSTLDNIEQGLQQNATLNYNTKLLKYFSFDQNLRYNGVGYFDQISQNYFPLTDSNGVIQDSIGIDTLNQFGSFHTGEYSAALTTKIYGLYAFSKLKKIKAMRHVLTPSIGYSFSPDFKTPFWNYFDFYQKGNLQGGLDTVYYSRYDGIFNAPPNAPKSSITFSLINDLQFKVLDKKDSTGVKTKKINLIENLSFSSLYNLRADSLKLAVFSFRGNINPIQGFSINFNGSLDPYKIDFLTRQRVDEFEISNWKNTKRLARLTFLQVRTGYTLKGKKTEQTQSENAAQEELEFIENNPEQFVDFTIPWSVGLNYNFSMRKSLYEPTYVNTLNFNSEVSITKMWKIGFESTYDLVAQKLVLPTIDIYRDLHCWQMAFKAILDGNRKSFQFNLNVKAPVLQSLKLNRRLEWFDNR